MDNKHRGAHSELIACAWLLGNGYEVFRNISPYGLMDIIAIKDGQMLKIDVKTKNVHGDQKLTKEQIDYGIVILNVCPSTGKCDLDLSPEPKQSMVAICEICGVTFHKYRHSQKRCSRVCEPEPARRATGGRWQAEGSEGQDRRTRATKTHPGPSYEGVGQARMAQEGERGGRPGLNKSPK